MKKKVRSYTLESRAAGAGDRKSNEPVSPNTRDIAAAKRAAAVRPVIPFNDLKVVGTLGKGKLYSIL